MTDPRWPEHLRWLRALSFLYPDWSDAGEKVAKTVLTGLNVSIIDSADVLQAYYNVCSDELEFTDKLSLLRRIVAVSKSRGEVLHYKLLHALLLAVYGDESNAKLELSQALAEFGDAAGESDTYTLAQYARALTTALRLDISVIQEPAAKAHQAFTAMLATGVLNAAGQAEVEFDRGSLYAVEGLWEQAKLAYERSLSLNSSPRAVVFLAEALAHLNSPQKAGELLASLNYEELDWPLKFDHCLTLALVASRDADCDHSLLSQRLSELETTTPAWAEQLRQVQHQVNTLERQQLEATIRTLRGPLAAAGEVSMTNAQVQVALAAHRQLPPRIQAKTLPGGRDLDALLTEIVVHACAKLQDQVQILSTEARSLEDTYTALVAALTEQRVSEFGWQVCEQNLGGLPRRASHERGRRDLVIKKHGDAPFAVIEALRCGNCTVTEASNIKEHIARLTARYDRSGGAHPIMLVYASGASFSEFWAWYKQQFSSEAFKDLQLVSPPVIPGEWIAEGLVRRSLKLMRTEHMLGGEVVAVTHVIVGM